MANIINGTDSNGGGLITTGDSSDELQLQTAEVARVTLTNTAVVVNESGADVDFRVEGDTDANLLFVDAGNDRVGIGTNTPDALLNVDGIASFGAGAAATPSIAAAGDLNTGIFFPAADNIGFATNGVIRGRWTTDGLCFGTDTAAANALDDYEEGTWTPAYVGSGGDPTVSYSGDTEGIYTKIGDTVFVSCEINAISSTGGSGDLRVAGLPFNVKNSSAGRAAGFSINFSAGFSSTTTPTSLLAEANLNYVVCRTNTTSDSRSNRSTTVAVSEIASGGRLFLSMTYKVN